MTPARFLLILVVVVVVLFGISLAVRKKTGEPSDSGPTNSLVSRINRYFEQRQKLDPALDLSGTNWHGNPLLLPPLQESVITITERKGKKLRKAVVAVKGGSPLKLNFAPSPEDPGAVDLEIKKVEPDKPVRLIFQEHGGTLKLKNQNPLTPLTVTIL